MEEPMVTPSYVRISCVLLLITSIAGEAERRLVQRAAEPGTERVSIVVELNTSPPSSVAEHEARIAGRHLDRATFEAGVRRGQEEFEGELRARGIDFAVTRTPVQVKGGTLWKENRFCFLVNAVGLNVPAGEVARIRAMRGVERVSLEREHELFLDNSVRYIRASDGPGNKTIFSRAGGPLERFDGTGQVIAIFDTGIEHTHAAFDTRFSDAQFLMRTGDLRPVRLAGEPYLDGTHHPKVVYSLTLTAATNEDDVGHGTHCAADSAGLKVKGPGLDRIPGNADDEIIEGVAPGALLMAYKLCETTFTCVGTLNIVTALEDALSPTDPLGNPKPVATVINMSFGGGAGDPDDPEAVAVDNAALLGAVVVASAGNSGPGERTIGIPAAARRAIAVGATNDPGAIDNETDVLPPDPLRYGLTSSSGAQNDGGRPKAPQDIPLRTVIMGGSPDVPFALGQHYMYVGLADTPDQVPEAVNGRIALAMRGSTIEVGDVTGSGAFAVKAAEAAARGAVALLVFNNVDGELEGTTAEASAIPVYGISRASGLYLRDTLGFQSPLFDPDVPATWSTLSHFPIRINLPDPVTFAPDTTGFSSRGPIEGSAYVKPDLTAPGFNVYSATIAAGGVSTGGGTMSDPSRFISVSGTSFSGPQVAGSAALVREALLDAHGVSPVAALALRSGSGAAEQQAQNGFVPYSLVRAALTSTATNLRTQDGETLLTDTDERSFIHEIGAGLVHVRRAVDVRAVLGTNDRNGAGGPDEASDPDFLPTHSFGEHAFLSNGVQQQELTITVTLENVAGASAAGSYALSLADGGAMRGDVTRPIAGTNGFALTLGSASVTLPATLGSHATFDVTVAVDGRPAPAGLAAAGNDVLDVPATEFLWWVVASGPGGVTLRMPFSFRAVTELPDPARKAPFLEAIADDATPDQTAAGVDRDGRYELSWTYPGEPAAQPCGFVIEQASSFEGVFADDGEELLVAGENSSWSGAEWVSAPHPDTTSFAYSPLYTDDADRRLTLIAPLALPAGTAVLSFASYEDIEEGFDYARVEASADGGPFLPLAVYTGAFSGRRRVDLTGFGGHEVRVRFRLVSDSLLSAPAFQGWFIDDIAIDTADFRAIATVDGATFHLEVSEGQRLRSSRERTLLYRVGGLFDGNCTTNGPFSNERSIALDPRHGGLR
jgi:subtilase family protein/PA domain-containing protein